MLTLLHTLLFLFGTAFILGFFWRDVETLLTSIFNAFKPVTEGAPVDTPVPPAEPPKSVEPAKPSE